MRKQNDFERLTQFPSLITRFFVTLGFPNFFDLKVQSAKASPLHSEMKRKAAFLLHFTRFSVTLEEIAAILCIKAVWGIEEKLGYELETVLNSTFCYKLHQRTPDDVPPAAL